MKKNCLKLAQISSLHTIILISTILPLMLSGQTLTPIQHSIHSNIGGYYESLPADYTTDTTKKFPLLIYMHSVSARGNGSLAQLPRILSDSTSIIPRSLQAGTFPSYFNVNGKKFSFVVICPQFVSVTTTDSSQTEALIDSCIKKYRIDTSRIYLTGILNGARFAWNYTGSSTSYNKRIAAMALASVSLLSPISTRANLIGAANLPTWLTGTYGDSGLSKRQNLQTAVNYINSNSPDPLARLSIFDTAMLLGRDSWTKAYDPAYKEDGLNVYEWMLQYTNSILIANAGPDQSFTFPTTAVTLNGSKSKARAGQITSYAWTKISGKSGTTITSPSSAVTTVTGLTDSTYLFQLTVTHTNGSSVSDTVMVSTQTNKKITKSFGDRIGGYLESLPVIYNNDTAKKFPLLIFLHGSGETGNGSQVQLDDVASNGIPKLIKEGKFPSTFNVNGEDFSFIVVSPQIVSSTGHSTTIPQQLNKLIDTCIKNYRVDTSRIYMTGLSMGGGLTWMYGSSYSNDPNRLAAILPICGSRAYNERPSSTEPLDTTRVAKISNSNLPVWATHNSPDPVVGTSYTNNWISKLNAYSPAMNPAAMKTIFLVASHDAWTQTYNPAYILDTPNNYNAYQWMLQYTNETLVAKAGPDQTITLPTSSVTLNGSTSLARSGRCSTYAWIKISGDTATITSSSSASTTVTGLSAGVYQFELTVRHTNNSTDKDTVTVTVLPAPSPRKTGTAVGVVKDNGEVTGMLNVKLNPNPVHSNLTVWITGKAKGRSSLTLYTLQGQRLSQQLFNKENENPVSRIVRTSNLPAGYYSILVTIGHHRKVVNFIKQ